MKEKERGKTEREEAKERKTQEEMEWMAKHQQARKRIRMLKKEFWPR